VILLTKIIDNTMQTKAFKSGNSLAVRIPKDLAIFEPSQDVIIERKGDTLVLRAVERKSLADVMDIFAQFSPDFMADGRGPEGWQDQKERDWSAWDDTAVHQDRLPYPATPNARAASATDAAAVTPKRKRK
jgi:antitoxin VapB